MDEFTYMYIEPQTGRSVVDYCVVPHETITVFNAFMIHKASQLISTSISSYGEIPAKSVSDHSMLSWNVVVQSKWGDNTESGECYKRRVFDTNNVPDSFTGEDCRSQVENIIEQLQSNIHAHVTVDDAFDQFCEIIYEEKKLRLKERIIYSGAYNKKRRVRKPRWSEYLTKCWNGCCVFERNWLRANGSEKKRQKQAYVENRKHFDRCVQRAKRQYRKDREAELVDLETKDHKEFWKKIGPIGVGCDRKRTIPMEITMGDGSIPFDKVDVLNKWPNDFCNLLNMSANQPSATVSNSTV